MVCGLARVYGVARVYGAASVYGVAMGYGVAFPSDPQQTLEDMFLKVLNVKKVLNLKDVFSG